MKKYLALLMTLVLLIAVCPAACAENQAGEAHVSVVLGEPLMALIRGEMEQDAAADALQRVLENVRICVRGDEKDAYVRLLLGSRELCDARIAVQEDGSVLLLTSLLPGTALKLPGQDAQKTDHGAFADKVKEDIKNYLGNGETGEFMLEGLSTQPYTVHYAIDLKDDALKQMVHGWVMEAYPGSWSDVFTVTSAYNQTEKPQDCHLYTRENGDAAFLLRETENDVCTDVLFALEDGEFVFALLPAQQANGVSVIENTAACLENGCEEGLLAMGEKQEDSVQLHVALYAGLTEMDLQYSHEKLDGAWYASLVTELLTDSVYVGAAGECTWDEKQLTGTFFVRYPENETFITLNLSGDAAPAPLPEISYDTVIDVENMADGQEEALEAQLTASAIKMFIYAASVMPDDMALLTNYYVMLENDALGIIGGADGPTTIVVADKTETPSAEPTERPTARPLFGQ